ncbi:MAG: DegT/DnrJ/EryC1/StrS family aminotransferase, partial [Spirochaetales bacterium]|nr:DegT/DnrJ/EryC1/StrS family aminotransferase [Spirochaetales bacterium]
DALHLILRAMEIGTGDEVIVPANTYIATWLAVTYAGAKPIPVEPDERTYNIDPNRIEEAITHRTRAILPVHLYGQPADMDPIISIAKKHNLNLVGDCAQAHGSLYKGKKIAQLADITCYSFYPGKNLGAYGDAGAIVTDNDVWAEKARKFANHGRAAKYNHEFEGVNSRMDGIQGAVLSVKLKYIEQWTEKRRRNAYLYNKLLDGLAVKTPVELDGVRAVYHLYVVRIEAAKREKFQAYLKENGIETGIHYPIALPYLQAYSYLNHSQNDFPESFKSSQEIVSLPMCPQLTEEQINYVAGIIKKF